ncbi:MAG TPA: calcium-binding protein [Chitinophagales bacterium]|nr:calcium-binding protein [Chitinophagales bacterium]
MKTAFKVGDSVVVNKGVMDADFPDYSLEGLQGRIQAIETDEEDATLVLIAWDSESLNSMRDYIPVCEEEGYDWQSCYLYTEEVSLASPRDTLEEVENTIQRLHNWYDWLDYGEEGDRIAAVLGAINAEDDLACHLAWQQHLQKKLSFPIAAEVTDDHEGDAHLRPGDRVKIKAFDAPDEIMGVMVAVNATNGHFSCPLSDLAAEDSETDAIIADYRTWYNCW